MQLLDGELVLSPSDLTGFSACEHLTQLELLAARGEIERADARRPAARRPLAPRHRARDAPLEPYEAEGHTTVVEIERRPTTPRRRSKPAAGRDARRDARRRRRHLPGHVLRRPLARPRRLPPPRRRRPSDLGDWSYEVADAKLARRVKAAALLQMCAYSEQRRAPPGRRAASRSTSSPATASATPFKLTDYSAYYRALKARFEALVLGAPSPTPSTYPDPGRPLRRSAAGPTCAPTAAAPTTTSRSSPACAATRPASSSPPASPRPPRSPRTPAGVDGRRHRRRARSSGSATRPSSRSKARGCVPPLYELLRARAARRRRRRHAVAQARARRAARAVARRPLLRHGRRPLRARRRARVPVRRRRARRRRRAALPARSGRTTATRRSAAFEQFIDFVDERRRRATPSMHIYHYAPYEPTAIKRLMGAHGTRETEVDELLRGERVRRPLRRRAPGRAHRRPSRTRSSRSRSSTCSARRAR